MKLPLLVAFGCLIANSAFTQTQLAVKKNLQAIRISENIKLDGIR